MALRPTLADPAETLRDVLTAPDLDEPATRETLARALRELERERRRHVFALERTIKDKEIASRMLDQTIEELRAKSDELAEHVRRLKLANEEMQSFLHVASHDLKTPLRSIGSFANLLARRYGDAFTEEATEYFGYIQTNAKAMSRVLDDLVAYNRTGAGVDHREDVALDELAAEVLLGLSSDIAGAGARVEYGGLGSARVARSAVSQLLQNLIGNAVVHRDLSRPLLVTVRRVPADAPTLRLEVEDNGPGLDEGFADKVFEPFKRVGDLARPGTGMGLAICRKLARQFGGDIRYRGRPGVGTTFVVELPQGE